MAVPFTQQATEALYYHSRELSDLISSNIGLIAVLGDRGRIEGITGGRGWNERVYYGTDPNAGHRERYAQVPTSRLENMTMAQYDGAFFSTSIVVNKVDVAEAKGEWALGDLVKDSWEIAKSYAVKKIGTDFWAATQANSNYPIPVPVMLPATLPASQTGTTRGGIDSAANSWWRSQAYITAIADLGAAAGLRILQAQMNACSRSSSTQSQPDFAVTTSNLFTRFTSTSEAYRRFTSDDRVAALGFMNVKYGPMTIIWDALCTASAFYMFNTRTLKVKYLNMPNLQSAKGANGTLSLPMVIEPMRDDIDTINFVSLMYLKYQLTCNDLGSNGILSSCTE